MVQIAEQNPDNIIANLHDEVRSLTAERDEAKAMRNLELRLSNQRMDKLAAATAECAALRNFVAFVNLWCHRESKVSDTERLSMIKFHPTAQAALGRLQQDQQPEHNDG